MVVFIIFIYGLLLPVLKINNTKQIFGENIRWYYTLFIVSFIYLPLSIYFYFLGYEYGLYESNETIAILINYTIVNVITLLAIILIFNLEYTFSRRERFKLKDKYSHNLGNILQSISSASYLTSMDKNINEESVKNLKLIEEKCEDAAKLIKEIRRL